MSQFMAVKSKIYKEQKLQPETVAKNRGHSNYKWHALNLRVLRVTFRWFTRSPRSYFNLAIEFGLVMACFSSLSPWYFCSSRNHFILIFFAFTQPQLITHYNRCPKSHFSFGPTRNNVIYFPNFNSSISANRVTSSCGRGSRTNGPEFSSRNQKLKRDTQGKKFN